MTILAAVNGEYEEDRVVSTAFDLAGAYDERLVVLHVMSNEEFADRQNATPEYFLENAEETARNVARRITRGTLGGVGDIEFRGEVGPGALGGGEGAVRLQDTDAADGRGTARRLGNAGLDRDQARPPALAFEIHVPVSLPGVGRHAVEREFRNVEGVAGAGDPRRRR